LDAGAIVLTIVIIGIIVGIIWAFINWWIEDSNKRQKKYLDAGCKAETFNQYGNGIISRCPTGTGASRSS
jgi:hypothetical protein